MIGQIFTCFMVLWSPSAWAESGEGVAIYPVVVACSFVIILSLFIYDISRRKQRSRLLASAQELLVLQKSYAKMEAENQSLAQALEHCQFVLSAVPHPMWRRGEDGAIVFCNVAYRALVEGVAAKDGAIPELDRKIVAQAQQALADNVVMRERRHIIVHGERKLTELVEIPLPEKAGTVGYALDMAEVELLQEDLTRHNSAMDDFLESSASAMAIYGADMRLKSFNYAFVALWKLDEMWLGTHPTYGEILENLREKRKLPEQANFQLFKQQQIKLFRDLINPKEEFFYLPDGKALRVLAIPHALGGIMFAYEDVTDRLALERSYNTLIAVQRETLDNLHEGVAVFGEDGRLKLSNPNYIEMWNVPAEFAKSEPHVRDILDKAQPLYVYEDWDGFKQSQVQLLQARAVHAQTLERADGKVLDWRKVPLPDGATLMTYRDITDSTLLERSLRDRNDALQEADRLKSQFLANVSYELRSPLTSISGFSEMLSQEYFGTLSPKQREYVDSIYQSSQRLMQLINDILDLASIEAGYMRLEVTRFEVVELMKSVASLIQERVREHGLKLKLEVPADIGTMLGDETRIKQILFNLLSNAIKYSNYGDKIIFGVRLSEQDEIVIWVQDHGQGVSAAEQQAIFNTFYRGTPTNTSGSKPAKRSGTGLGLSIVKSFMEMHGGRIELFSEPGKGARFECVFLRDNPKLIVG